MELHMLYWHWLVLGVVLVVAEIFIPSFTILWFGLGALVVGVVALLVDIPFSLQVLQSLTHHRATDAQGLPQVTFHQTLTW